MNILVIESNEKLSTEVVDNLNEIFKNDPEVKITTSGDLDSGAALTAIDGIGPIGLIVCAETVTESARKARPSNGLAFMRKYRRNGASTPIIVLTEEGPKEKLVDGIYMVHRHSSILEHLLLLAANHFFPDLVH